jgi:hypothetical protein
VAAAVVGVAIGAGLVYLMARRSEHGGRALGPMMRRLGRNVSDYVDNAREAIDDAVSAELHDLRRSIRRRRKRFGV